MNEAFDLKMTFRFELRREECNKNVIMVAETLCPLKIVQEVFTCLR